MRLIARSVLFLSLILLATTATAQLTDFLASGRVPIKDGDTLTARDAALIEAGKKAVERAILAIGGSDILETSKNEIEENILPNAASYIKKTAVTGEGPEGAFYRVGIRAEVDLKALKKDLQASGVASGKASSRPRVMVLIDEYFGTDSTPRDKPTLAREVTMDSSKSHAAAARASSDSAAEAAAASAQRSSDSSSKGSIDAAETDRASGKTTIKGEVRSGSDRASGEASASGSTSSDAKLKAHWDNKDTEKESGSASYSKSAAHSSSASSVKDDQHFAMTIKEYFPDGAQTALPDSSAGAEISSQLLKEDFNLVDKAMVQQLREEELGKNGYMVDFLRNNTSVARAARAASQKYGADYLVIGACRVVYRGIGEDQQHISGATLILKVVNASTGQVLASDVNVEPGMSGDAQSSHDVAAKRVGITVGESLTSQLAAEARNRERAGIEIGLSLFGVPDIQAKVAFGAILEALDGVQSVEERTYDRANRRVEYQVTFRGTVTQFKNSLLKRAFSEKRWSGLDEQNSIGNTVNLVLKGTK